MSHDATFKFLNSIHETKTDLLESEYQPKDYNPYFVNRYLSSNMDTVLYAQEMNQRYHIPQHMQYDYLRTVIKSRRRKCSWGKKIKVENVDIVKLYYNCSTKDALRYLELLTDEQINKIKLICNNLK